MKALFLVPGCPDLFCAWGYLVISAFLLRAKCLIGTWFENVFLHSMFPLPPGGIHLSANT